MKYRFTIGFEGEIERKPNETLDDIEQVVRESFRPDTVAGVWISGMHLNFHKMHDYPGQGVLLAPSAEVNKAP